MSNNLRQMYLNLFMDLLSNLPGKKFIQSQSQLNNWMWLPDVQGLGCFVICMRHKTILKLELLSFLNWCFHGRNMQAMHIVRPGQQKAKEEHHFFYFKHKHDYKKCRTYHQAFWKAGFWKKNLHLVCLLSNINSEIWTPSLFLKNQITST